jgi:hypothetical protein
MLLLAARSSRKQADVVGVSPCILQIQSSLFDVVKRPADAATARSSRQCCITRTSACDVIWSFACSSAANETERNVYLQSASLLSQDLGHRRQWYACGTAASKWAAKPSRIWDATTCRAGQLATAAMPALKR